MERWKVMPNLASMWLERGGAWAGHGRRAPSSCPVNGLKVSQIGQTKSSFLFSLLFVLTPTFATSRKPYFSNF